MYYLLPSILVNNHKQTSPLPQSFPLSLAGAKCVSSKSCPQVTVSGNAVKEYWWWWGFNDVADLLSRDPALSNTFQQNTTSFCQLNWENCAFQCSKFFLSSFKKSANELKARKFTYDGQCWRKTSCIDVPNFGNLRTECISVHHDAVYTGHFGHRSYYMTLMCGIMVA